MRFRMYCLSSPTLCPVTFTISASFAMENRQFSALNSTRRKFRSLTAVLRIHDIFVWIRIRGSMPLINGSWFGFESGSCHFSHWPSRRQPKTNLKKFFCLLLSKLHSHHFSKIKSKKKSQNSRNQGFSSYFCLIIEGSGSVPLTNGSATLPSSNYRKVRCPK